MAALMMAGTNSADSMAGMNMSDMNMHAGASAPPAISPELSMPYGFAKPGHYRIFYSSNIETAHFDTVVN